MADTSTIPSAAEPAGAERFRAVSKPESRVTPASTSEVGTSIDALETRLTELEAVVHAIAPYSRNASHGTVVTWLEKVGERISALVKKL